MKKLLVIGLFLVYGATVYAACPGYRREEGRLPDATSENAPLTPPAASMQAPEVKSSERPSGESEDILGEIFGKEGEIFGEEIEGPEGIEEELEIEKYD